MSPPIPSFYSLNQFKIRISVQCHELDIIIIVTINYTKLLCTSLQLIVIPLLMKYLALRNIQNKIRSQESIRD